MWLLWLASLLLDCFHLLSSGITSRSPYPPNIYVFMGIQSPLCLQGRCFNHWAIPQSWTIFLSQQQINERYLSQLPLWFYYLPGCSEILKQNWLGAREPNMQKSFLLRHNWSGEFFKDKYPGYHEFPHDVFIPVSGVSGLLSLQHHLSFSWSGTHYVAQVGLQLRSLAWASWRLGLLALQVVNHHTWLQCQIFGFVCF